MLIEAAQRFSTEWPPYICTSIVLVCGAILTGLLSVLLKRSEAFRVLPGAGFVAIGASTFWPVPAGWRYAALAVAALLLCLHFTLSHDTKTDPRSLDEGSSRVAYAYLGASLLVAGAFLFYDLGGYAGTLLTWEGATVEGFANSALRGESPVRSAEQAFLWHAGLLSSGNDSLYYGATTYALFSVIGFSTWTLRIVSVICALLSIVVIFALSRRFFGNTVASAVSATLALSSSFLFYGRYASSPAGTVLATLVALYCVWVFLDDDRSAWWLGGVAAGALYLATLQYATSRIVVLILLCFVPLVALLQWRKLSWRRAAGLLLFTIGVLSVWHLQGAFGRRSVFLAVRGEQFFHLSEIPQVYMDRLGLTVDAGEISLKLKLLLLLDLLRANTSYYLSLMLPWVEPHLTTSRPLFDGAGQHMTPYYAPFALFVTWGVTHSLLRIKRWPHTCLFLYFLGCSAALMMTTHVDGHRAIILVIPISLWIGFGFWEAIQLIRKAEVPQLLQHVLAGALALTLVYNLLNLLYFREAPKLTKERAVLQEISHISQSVILGYADWRGEDVRWVHLGMLERARLNPGWKGTLLHPALLDPSRDRAPTPPTDTTLDGLEQEIKDAVLILAPATAFRHVASKLKERGAKVEEVGPPEFPLLRIEGANIGSS